MSFGGGYNGGRVRMTSRVYLNVYDLTVDMNQVLYPVGLGLHHSGVEIDGVEYSFGSGGGMFEIPPKMAPDAVFREQYDMGTFDGGKAALHKALDELRAEFGAHDYHLIRKNCNTFSNALCYKLLKQPIPAHVNRIADIGNCCSWFLPAGWLDNSPVAGNKRESGSSSSPPQGMTMMRGGSNRSMNTPAFTGKGARLGSASSGSTSPTSPTQRKTTVSSSFWNTPSMRSVSSDSSSTINHDELLDRREKARRAALARLERAEKERLKTSSSC